MRSPRLAAILAPLLIAAAPAPKTTETATVAWIRANEVPLGASESELGRREAGVIAAVIAGARVIGLGEPFHGHEEPLAYRNRLIRHLVAHQGLTAVALESGIAETKRVGDYVLGGPGNATSVVHDNLSWRFGDLQANVELVNWLREWNLAHPNRRVRLYGIDISGGDARAEFGRSRASVDHVVAFLARAAPAESTAIRRSLSEVAGRFSNAGYAGMSADERVALHDALLAAGAFIDGHRRTLLSTSSADDVEWAVRVAHDMLDAERVFAVWPSDPQQPLPGALLVANIRDRAMAANTQWALAREGARGRILLFESSTHVGAAPMRPPGREKEGGTSAGQELRRALGPSYRVIVTASSLGKNATDPAIGSIDRALVAAGPTRAVLNIRSAPDWWDQPQTLAHGGARVNTVVPRRAFDGIIYVGALTTARMLSMETAR